MDEIWAAIWSWIESANAFLAPWLQQYDLVRNAPVVVIAVALAVALFWLWKLLVSGPRRRRKEAEAETARHRKESERDSEITRVKQSLAAQEKALADQAADVKRALAILTAKSEGALDAVTTQTLETSLANLFSAQEGAKKRASEKLLAGDRDGALSELQQFAARENEAVAKAAETQKEIGALAFPDRTADAIAAYERAVQLAPDDTEARNQLGHLYFRTGDLAAAEAAYRSILDGAGKTDESWQAAALGNLGTVAETRGDLDAAEDYHRRALALDEKLGSLEGQADDFGSLGNVARTWGDLDAAEDYHKRALALNEKLGRLEGQADTLGNLGNVALTRGDLDAAEDYHRRALALNEKLGRLEGQASDLANLGNVAKTRGDVAGAEAYWRRSLALYRRIGIPHMVDKLSDWLRSINANPDSPT